MLIMLSVHGRDSSTIYYLRLHHPQLGGSARAKQRGLANVYYPLHLLAQFAGARARAFPSYFICSAHVGLVVINIIIY